MDKERVHRATTAYKTCSCLLQHGDQAGFPPKGPAGPSLTKGNIVLPALTMISDVRGSCGVYGEVVVSLGW